MVLVLPILLMMLLVVIGLFVVWLGTIVIYLGSFLGGWRRVRLYLGCLVVGVPLFAFQFLNDVQDGIGWVTLLIGIGVVISGPIIGNAAKPKRRES
jgi:hypothetical protein